MGSYIKITLHNEGREIKEGASDTLEAADRVAKTALLRLVQCRHVKPLQNESSKFFYFIFFYNASLSNES